MQLKKQLSILCLTIIILSIAATTVTAGNVARIKDIARIEGARNNQLVGYGLVVGLDGTGDTQQAIFTTQSVANMLKRLGIDVPDGKLKVKNVAAVMVTAELPPFVRPGAEIDVIVSSLGDARSLQGGTLLQTPLQAATQSLREVYQSEDSLPEAAEPASRKITRQSEGFPAEQSLNSPFLQLCLAAAQSMFCSITQTLQQPSEWPEL